MTGLSEASTRDTVRDEPERKERLRLIGIVEDNVKRTKREAEEAAEASDWATQEKRDREHHYWRGYLAGLTRTTPLDWLIP